MAVLVDDATHPLDSDVADPASQGAGELRALKAKVNGLYLNTGISATQAHLVDLAKGTNAVLSTAAATDAYGGQWQITRTANAVGKNTFGGNIRAILANNIQCANLQGFNIEAQTGTGCTVTAMWPVGALLTQQSVALNATVAGVSIIYANRITPGNAAPGGLGVNQYNKGASAIL